eukprot:4735875-Pleurochrysis_carterae.AAC.1
MGHGFCPVAGRSGLGGGGDSVNDGSRVHSSGKHRRSLEFRVITQKWQRKGYALTPSGLDALPNATVHPIQKYVHNSSAFYEDDIYNFMAYLTTAREFIIRKRSDGVTAFWYKPDSSHVNLYPTAKGDEGRPIQSSTGGQKVFEHCTFGIEMFRT